MSAERMIERRSAGRFGVQGAVEAGPDYRERPGLSGEKKKIAA